MCQRDEKAGNSYPQFVFKGIIYNIIGFCEQSCDVASINGERRISQPFEDRLVNFRSSRIHTKSLQPFSCLPECFQLLLKECAVISLARTVTLRRRGAFCRERLRTLIPQGLNDLFFYATTQFEDQKRVLVETFCQQVIDGGNMFAGVGPIGAGAICNQVFYCCGE